MLSSPLIHWQLIAHSEQTRANERGAPMPHQPALLQVGLGASVWTLVLGMLVSNGLGRVTSISVLEPGAKRAEFWSSSHVTTRCI